MIKVSKRVKEDRKNKVLHSDKSEAGLLELKPCLTAHTHSLPTCPHIHTPHCGLPRKLDKKFDPWPSPRLLPPPPRGSIWFSSD